MEWYQIVMIVLLTGDLVIHLVKHGECKTEYNVFVSAFSVVLTSVLLYFGGFWS